MKSLTNQHALLGGIVTAVFVTAFINTAGTQFSAMTNGSDTASFFAIDVTYLCKLPGFSHAPACSTYTAPPSVLRPLPVQPPVPTVVEEQQKSASKEDIPPIVVSPPVCNSTCGNGTVDPGEVATVAEIHTDGDMLCAKDFVQHNALPIEISKVAVCGNSICETGESAISCSSDCGSDVEILATECPQLHCPTRLPGQQYGAAKYSKNGCMISCGELVSDEVSKVSVCGDGIVQTGEQCDDKNVTNGDGCSSTCQIELKKWESACGNGVVDPGEVCDLGSKNGSNGCSTTCTFVYCQETDCTEKKPRTTCTNGTPALFACNDTFGQRPERCVWQNTNCPNAWCGDGIAALGFGEDYDRGIDAATGLPKGGSGGERCKVRVPLCTPEERAGLMDLPWTSTKSDALKMANKLACGGTNTTCSINYVNGQDKGGKCNCATNTDCLAGEVCDPQSQLCMKR